MALIRVGRQNGVVNVEAQDHGKGMSPEKLAEIQSKGSGVGIRGMRERLREYKGTLNIESGASGTKVAATIPVQIKSAIEEPKEIEPLQTARIA